MVKVSVVIPVYNAEKHIEKTINSLLTQTFKDIEFIFVNDGSKDKSLEILREYEKKDNRVIVIDQTNSGPGGARNSGILKARGEYIGFLDSDDFVTENMYEALYNKAKDKNFDIVECDFRYTDGNKTWEGIHDLNSDILSLQEKKKYMIRMYPVLWNKIYKYNKVKQIFFTEGVFAEDVEYLYRVMPAINTIGYVNNTYYYYYQRPDSESNSYGQKLYDYITNFNSLVDYYKKNGIYNEYKDEIEYCYVRYNYATFIKRATIFDKNQYVKATNIVMKNVKEKFPNYKKNKYINQLSFKNIYLKYFNKFLANVVYLIENRKI